MDIRRYYYPGQIVFITQVIKGRKPVFRNPEMMGLLNETFTNIETLHPFTMLAYVFLPDHFHILIRPTGQSNFSQIMHSLKINFTREYKLKTNHTGSLSFWQKRFWDHVIRDETDLVSHIHYIHYNPVKHGYATDSNTWLNSSSSTWHDRGLYDNLWEYVEPENPSWGE